MGDAEVHQVCVANGVYSRNDDVLYFGVFVPQVDIPDGVIPVNPFASSFKLHKK